MEIKLFSTDMPECVQTRSPDRNPRFHYHARCWPSRISPPVLQRPASACGLRQSAGAARLKLSPSRRLVEPAQLPAKIKHLSPEVTVLVMGATPRS